MNKYQIKHGDAIELMKKIPDNFVDCIITDPPYKMTSRGSSGTMGGEFWTSDRAKKGILFEIPELEDYIDELYRVLKDGTHAYIMTNDKNLIDYGRVIKNSKFKFVKTVIWVKPNKICGRWYMTQKETIYLIRKGKARPINNPGTADVIMTPEFRKTKIDGKIIHDTEKPVELMKILLENSTNEGEIVFDPFMGSGSTGVAALESNRKFIGTEIMDKYFKVSKSRIEKV